MENYTLVKNGEERTVTSPSERVSLRFDGWQDKPAQEPAPVPAPEVKRPRANLFGS